MSDKKLQLPPVNDVQLATILAALRTYADAEAPLTEHFDGIEQAENGVDAPFADELAEYLNCGSAEIDDDETDESGTAFTVLMMYPEYLSDEHYGEETYLAHVVAASAEAAMEAAQDEAYEAAVKRQGYDPEDDEPEGDPSDFTVLLCAEGHLTDLSQGAPRDGMVPGP